MRGKGWATEPRLTGCHGPGSAAGERDGETEAAVPAGAAAQPGSRRDGAPDDQCLQRCLPAGTPPGHMQPVPSLPQSPISWGPHGSLSHPACLRLAPQPLHIPLTLQFLALPSLWHTTPAPSPAYPGMVVFWWVENRAPRLSALSLPHPHRLQERRAPWCPPP